MDGEERVIGLALVRAGSALDDAASMAAKVAG
jgi:hypothetical protein